MKRLTDRDIKRINDDRNLHNGDEGIFRESSYVPTNIKDYCCVLRWRSESRGGSCWDDSDTIHEIYYEEEPNFRILDLALKEIGVSKEQENYITTYFINYVNDAGGYVGYYGDYDDYKAKWIELEKIYKYLGI